jgi:Immunoglobulin domain
LQKFNISVLVAPTIKKSPLSLVYPIAKTVRFECEFEGMPKPNITWYKNGELLHINGRIKQKVWTLVLSNTVKEDSGIYQVRSRQTKIRDFQITQLICPQCRGWNKAGEVWAAARLTEQAGKQESSINVPNGLHCSNITINSVWLSWEKLTQQVTAYTVHYLPSGKFTEYFSLKLTFLSFFLTQPQLNKFTHNVNPYHKRAF